MSYNPQEQDSVFDKQLEKLHHDLTICHDVENTINTPGWKTIIAPTIDKMIIDVMGGKIGNNWASGTLDRARSDERREFYIGYKQALIKFHNQVMNHLRQIPILEKQIKQIEEEKRAPMRVPLEDTRYNLEEQI